MWTSGVSNLIKPEKAVLISKNSLQWSIIFSKEKFVNYSINYINFINTKFLFINNNIEEYLEFSFFEKQLI